MEIRRFGRSGHMSSVAIFGACSVGRVTQAQADVAIERVIAAGINHIDVAPSYGEAEARLGSWIARERQRFFLGCKTTERTKEGAAAELQRSFKRLQTDYFDLYQLHGITTFKELDQVTASGGALEAFIEAHKAGVIGAIGITGHGMDAPAVFLEALRRYDFASVLFPLNFILYADAAYRKNAEALIAECHKKDVGMMTIKSISRGPWGNKPHQYDTWYEPFDDPAMIHKVVNFVLSQDITGICTACDPHLLPEVIKACQEFKPMSKTEQDELIATAGQYGNLFQPF